MDSFICKGLTFDRVQALLQETDPLIEAELILSAVGEEEGPDQWACRFYTTNGESLKAVLQEKGLVWHQEAVEECDWVSRNLETFEPLDIGCFYIYGSHLAQKEIQPSPAQIPLLMDAGCAFGSGRHFTTEGCLVLMSDLREQGFEPKTMLDLGCGSGILAIAAKLLWPKAEVYAIDNDPEATHMTMNYAKKNGVEITIITHEGVKELELPPFHLIVANILANPLKLLAPDLLKVLAPGGKIILSGLLETQGSEVLQAYIPLRLEDQFLKEGWGSYLLSA